MSAFIHVEGLFTQYRTTAVLKDIHMNIEKGDFVGIVGPNGSGKTTLLNNIGRLVPYQKGKIVLNERDLSQYKNSEAARIMSAVSQSHPADIEFTVYDVVMMGRTPHWNLLSKVSARDRLIVEDAMNIVGIQNLSGKKTSELSGGERQRVFIAQAIAQDPSVMLLDEPTSHLDIRYQIGIMDALKRLNRESSVTVVAVLHDLNLAAQYCNKLIMISEGMVAGIGSPADVLQKERIEAVYRTTVAVTEHPVTGAPYVVLYSREMLSDPEPRTDNHQRVHIIAGGGAGVSLMDTLAANGYALSAGVLNVGDSDWQKAQDLQITVVDEMPFSNISPAKKEENLSMARKSDVVVVASTPFGSGNLANVEILEDIAIAGIPVIIMDADSITDRDYTDGKASRMIRNIMSHPHVYSVTESDVLVLLKELTGG